MAQITVGLIEPVIVFGKKRIKVLGKFDTGARRTSICRELAEKLHLKKTGHAVVGNVYGRRKRPVVELKLIIKGRRFKVRANVANRESRTFKLLVGRDIIFNNFIVDVSKSHNSPNLESFKRKVS